MRAAGGVPGSGSAVASLCCVLYYLLNRMAARLAGAAGGSRRRPCNPHNHAGPEPGLPGQDRRTHAPQPAAELV